MAEKILKIYFNLKYYLIIIIKSMRVTLFYLFRKELYNNSNIYILHDYIII